MSMFISQDEKLFVIFVHGLSMVCTVHASPLGHFESCEVTERQLQYKKFGAYGTRTEFTMVRIQGIENKNDRKALHYVQSKIE